MDNKFKIFLYAVCSLVLPNAQATSNNIIDSTYGAGAGSFELGSFVAVGTGFNSYMSIVPGDTTTITGWTVGGPGDGVDWVTSFYKPDTGIYAVDLAHSVASSISTVIPTVVGDKYELTFGAASVIGYSNTGIFSAGSLVNQAFTTTFSSNFPTQSYTPFSFLFTASGATTTIQFTSAGNTTYGPLIDSVSVSAVPVPAAVWLFSFSLAGLVSFGRCKSNNF